MNELNLFDLILILFCSAVVIIVVNALRKRPDPKANDASIIIRPEPQYEYSLVAWDQGIELELMPWGPQRILHHERISLRDNGWGHEAIVAVPGVKYELRVRRATP